MEWRLWARIWINARGGKKEWGWENLECIRGGFPISAAIPSNMRTRKRWQYQSKGLQANVLGKFTWYNWWGKKKIRVLSKEVQEKRKWCARISKRIKALCRWAGRIPEAWKSRDRSILLQINSQLEEFVIAPPPPLHFKSDSLEE